MQWVYTFFYICRISWAVLCSGVWIQPTCGVRWVALLRRMGPTYIKLGQTLATRPDLVGSGMAKALADLQDKLPPFSTRHVKKLIEKELGQPVEEVFSQFDIEAVAAASIAQVHKATLHDGTVVAVKLLRPGIERKFARDIRFLHKISQLFNGFEECKRLRLPQVIAYVEETITYELDLRFEAAAASELAENCQHDHGVHVPEVYWDYVSRRVFVLEWVDGISIYNTEALEATELDVHQVAERFLLTYFNQAYRDGFFHADMHPGNVFVDSAGRIVPVDFGIMGRLDERTRLFVTAIFKGFMERDYRYVAQVHFDAGYVPANQSIERFAQACRSIGEPVINKPLSAMSLGRLLAQLFKITKDFGMETQPQLLLLQKTMVLVEGICGKLHPTLNMQEFAAPWVRQWAKEHMGAKAQLRRAKTDIRQFAMQLPGYVDMLDQLRHNVTPEGIRFHPDTIRQWQEIKRQQQMGFKRCAGAIILLISAVFYIMHSVT